MKKLLALITLSAMIASCVIFPVSADNNADDTLLISPSPSSQNDLLISANPTAETKVYLKTLKTSNDPKNYLQLTVAGDTLKLSGMASNAEIAYLLVPFAGNNIVINVLEGSRFTVKFDLSAITDDEYEFTVYSGKSLTDEFISIFYGNDIILKKHDGEWSIVLEKEVFENNTQYLSGWIDETEAVETDIPERIRLAAENAVSDLENDYDKARAIHEYVASTIYYDLDYAKGITSSTAVTAQEVYDKGVAVCEGYSNLTVALLRSVGIPAVCVKGYCLGIDSSSWDNADKTQENHMWVEAFVDGKWIVMDPSWDSKNTVINGEKSKTETNFYRYFDVTAEMLSGKHFINYRPNVFGLRGLSSWALEEAQEAYRFGLITSACSSAMPDAITRLEFCDLLMNMLSVKLGVSVEKILQDRGLEINPGAFVDTDYYNILAANALGIVNGKEDGKFDPDGTIRRQEAAAMLQRAAVNVLGVEKANSTPVEFTDSETFDSWGKDAIAFVSASADRNGRKVMGGKEEGKFAPFDLYTKEQSVLTVLRLYTAY